MKIDHKTISMVILLLRLIQEGLLSVTNESHNVHKVLVKLIVTNESHNVHKVLVKLIVKGAQVTV